MEVGIRAWIVIFIQLFSLCAMAKTGIIFLPGLAESHLKSESTGKRVYFSLFELWRDQTLALDLKELEIPNAIPLVEDGVMHTVNIYGASYFLDFSNSIKFRLDSLDSTKYDVHYFAYDWRLSIDHLAGELKKFLDSKEHITDWVFVTHSMGGLIASYFMRYGDQPIATAKENWEGLKYGHKMIFAGTPFRGSIRTFQEMVKGTKPFGTTNASLLSAQASSSFPSYYQLFPFSGEKGILNTELENIKEDVFTADVFEKERWGLFEDDLPIDLQRKRKTYVFEQIKKARMFSDLMLKGIESWPQKKMEVLNIISKEYDTLTNVIYEKSSDRLLKNLIGKKSELKKRRDLLPETLYSEGDGTVTAASMVLPEWLKGISCLEKEIKIDKSHAFLFSEKSTLDKVMDFIPPTMSILSMKN